MRTGQSRRTPGAWSDRREHSESDLGEEVKKEAEDQYWYSTVLGAERRFQIRPDTCKHLVEARRLDIFLPTSFPVVSLFWNYSILQTLGDPGSVGCGPWLFWRLNTRILSLGSSKGSSWPMPESSVSSGVCREEWDSCDLCPHLWDLLGEQGMRGGTSVSATLSLGQWGGGRRSFLTLLCTPRPGMVISTQHLRRRSRTLLPPPQLQPLILLSMLYAPSSFSLSLPGIEQPCKRLVLPSLSKLGTALSQDSSCPSWVFLTDSGSCSTGKAALSTNGIVQKNMWPRTQSFRVWVILLWQTWGKLFYNLNLHWPLTLVTGWS